VTAPSHANAVASLCQQLISASKICLPAVLVGLHVVTPPGHCAYASHLTL